MVGGNARNTLVRSGLVTAPGVSKAMQMNCLGVLDAGGEPPPDPDAISVPGNSSFARELFLALVALGPRLIFTKSIQTVP